MQLRIPSLLQIVFGLALVQGLLFAYFSTMQLSHSVAAEPQLHLQEAIIAKPQPHDASPLLARLGLLPTFNRMSTLAAVSISNHEGARPFQQGLDHALFITEWPVYNRKTNLVALFDIESIPPDIGPVSPVSSYMASAVAPWTHALFHAGGSVAPHTTIADVHVGTPAHEEDYSIVAHGREIVRTIESLPHSYTQWPPYALSTKKGSISAYNIDIRFYDTPEEVRYTYDTQIDSYQRTNGNVIRQGTPRNVLILEWTDFKKAVEQQYDDFTGQGKAFLFHSGTAFEGQWIKESPRDTLRILDNHGQPLPFQHGQTWATIVRSLNRVHFTGPAVGEGEEGLGH